VHAPCDVVLRGAHEAVRDWLLAEALEVLEDAFLKRCHW
jgi:hypothetical protein